MTELQCFLALFCWIFSSVLFLLSSPRVCCIVTMSVAMSETVWPLDLSSCRYPKDTKLKFNNLKSKKASSFHEFARSTNDAWDIDDEEDEDFLGTPAPASTLPSGLHSTSTQNQVVTRHHFYHCATAGIELALKWDILMCFLCSHSHCRIRQVTQKTGCHTNWLFLAQKLKTSKMFRRTMQTASMSMARLSSPTVRPTSTRPQVSD